MGKNILLIVGAVIAVILIIVIAGVMGFIDLGFVGLGNNAPSPGDLGFNDTSDAQFSDFDIYAMLCIITDKSLDRETTLGYIDSLNMDVYGSSDSYVDIYGEYSQYYENQGWNLEYRSFFTDTALIVYSDTGQGASVVTSSRPAMETMYGYHTMTLTSTGNVGTYMAFINFVQSS